MMKTPPYLRSGDRIGIVSTARKLLREDLSPALETFSSWGLTPVLGNRLFHEENQYAGTDAQRKADFQAMLDDPEIKAVVFARGGYGTVRIIDEMDFSSFVAQPKWLVGFSDITVIHSHVHTQLGIETLHAPMPYSFRHSKLTEQSVECLRKALFGERLAYRYEPMLPVKTGEATGILTGGNLSMLYALNNTPSDIHTEGKILFLEDLDEYLYHIDRMMLTMKRSGKLEKLAGLVVGGMTEMRDNEVPFGKMACEIILETAGIYGYPICTGFPAGHMDDNRALILGRNVILKVGEEVELVFTE